MPNASLHVIEVRGNSRQRGIQHGRQLRTAIDRAVSFYEEFFRQHLDMTPREMQQRAARYIDPTAALSPHLADEFEGIAEGSQHPLETIYALTARYEITFERIKLGECSNVFVGSDWSADGGTLLGMNWEWRPEVMDFRAVITSRCDDGPDHIVVTECGSPGKYGLNEAGIAAIETGLGCSRPHGMGRQLFANVIRHTLAQASLGDAVAVVRRHPPEATVSFMLADATGNGVNVECTPDGLHEQTLGGGDLAWHTNHCRLTTEPCDFADSFARGRRWEQLLADVAPASVDAQRVGAWLADRAGGADAICKLPNPASANSATYLQTLCSIVLAPRARATWVSDGPSCNFPYRSFALADQEAPV